MKNSLKVENKFYEISNIALSEIPGIASMREKDGQEIILIGIFVLELVKMDPCSCHKKTMSSFGHILLPKRVMSLLSCILPPTRMMSSLN